MQNLNMYHLMENLNIYRFIKLKTKNLLGPPYNLSSMVSSLSLEENKQINRNVNTN